MTAGTAGTHHFTSLAGRSALSSSGRRRTQLAVSSSSYRARSIFQSAPPRFCAT